MLKEKLKKILSTNSFTSQEAKELEMSFKKEAIKQLPEDIQNEINNYFLSIDFFLHEVEEGYVDGDESDDILLQESKNILKILEEYKNKE